MTGLIITFFVATGLWCTVRGFFSILSGQAKAPKKGDKPNGIVHYINAAITGQDPTQYSIESFSSRFFNLTGKFLLWLLKLPRALLLHTFIKKKWVATLGTILFWIVILSVITYFF